MKNRISQQDAIKAVGMGHPTVKDWVRRGLLSHPPYTMSEVTGLFLAKWLRSKGIGFEIVERMMDFFRATSEEALQAHIDAGEKTLAIELISGRVFLCGDNAEFRIDKMAQFLLIDVEAARDRVDSYCAAVGKGLAEHEKEQAEMN